MEILFFSPPRRLTSLFEGMRDYVSTFYAIWLRFIILLIWLCRDNSFAYGIPVSRHHISVRIVQTNEHINIYFEILPSSCQIFLTICKKHNVSFSSRHVITVSVTWKLNPVIVEFQSNSNTRHIFDKYFDLDWHPLCSMYRIFYSLLCRKLYCTTYMTMGNRILQKWIFFHPAEVHFGLVGIMKTFPRNKYVRQLKILLQSHHIWEFSFCKLYLNSFVMKNSKSRLGSHFILNP